MELQVLTISNFKEIEEILKENEFLFIQNKDIQNKHSKFVFKQRTNAIVYRDTNHFSNNNLIEKVTNFPLSKFNSYVVLFYDNSTGCSNYRWHDVTNIVTKFKSPFILTNKCEEYYIQDFANTCNEKFREKYVRSK